MHRRTWIIIGGLVIAMALLAAGALVGGGLAIALARGQASSAVARILDTASRRLTLAEREATSEAGLVIASVDAGGPAAAAGIARGDILLELDGRSVDSLADLAQVLADASPGDAVRVTFQHGDDERNVTVTLAEEDGKATLGITPCVAAPCPGASRIVVPPVPLGAVVVSVTPGSPADDAGIQEGDVITAVDGVALTPKDGLAGVISAREPGERVALEVMRPGDDGNEAETLTLEVELGRHPDDSDRAYLGVRYRLGLGKPFGDRQGPFDWFPGEGLPETPFERLMGGAIIQRVADDSPAEQAGLREGDRITAVDGSPVTTPREVTEAIAEHKPGDRLTLTVDPRGDEEEHEVVVTLGEHPDDAERAYLGVLLLQIRRLGHGTDGWEFRPPFQDRRGNAEDL